MKQKDILYILGSIFVLVLAWTASNVYHNVVTSTIPEATSIQIVPISPSFDLQAIERLKKRQMIEPLFEIKPSISPTATKEAEIIPEATDSAQQNLP